MSSKLTAATIHVTSSTVSDSEGPAAVMITPPSKNKHHSNDFAAIVQSLKAIHWERSGYAILFGATVGAFLDFLHTHGDEIRYPEETNHWRGVLTFLVVYWQLGWMCAWFNSYFGTHTPKPYKVALPHVVSYCLEYAFTAYADFDSKLMASIMLCCGLYHWYTLDRTMPMMGAAVTIAILGAFAESCLQTYGGTMTYTVQDIGGVPAWLPFIYFSGCTSWGVVCHRLFSVDDHMDVGVVVAVVATEDLEEKNGTVAAAAV